MLAAHHHLWWPPVLNEHVARKKPDEAEIEKQKSKACELRAAPKPGAAAGLRGCRRRIGPALARGFGPFGP